jgi:hypothetical protein
MTAQQHGLFGPPQTVKSKPKALTKQAPPPSASPQPSKLSPSDTMKRAKNLARVHAERARMTIGTIRMSGVTCKACGEERVEELIDIAAQGGQTWETRCLACQGDKP